MNRKSFGAGLVALALATTVVACSSDDKKSDDCARASDSEMDALFTKWNDALVAGDASKVAALYRPDAVLLPTLSQPIADTPAEITEYFVNLIKAKPVARMVESHKESYCNVAYNVGLWTINANGADVQARVTWVYNYQDGNWAIAHHHSSVDPTPA